MFAGLLSVIKSQLKAHSACIRISCYFSIEVYMFLYSELKSYYVSQMETKFLNGHVNNKKRDILV